MIWVENSLFSETSIDITIGGGQLKYVLFSPQKIGEDDFPNLTNPHNFCSDGLVFKTTN